MSRRVHRCLLHTLEAAAADSGPSSVPSTNEGLDVASYLSKMERQMLRKASYQQQLMMSYSPLAPAQKPAANPRPRPPGVAALMQPISLNCAVNQPACFRALHF